ncbi:MAG: hypothetical protein IJR44_05560 [Neisseriaceae bacterium]|nr:hypothetical protein [Neisseriaceae bacterium]
METTPYSVTVKFAPAGTALNKGGKSLTGHVWYEVSDGITTKSYGWSAGDKWTLGGRENLIHDDMYNYRADADHHISSIRIDNISKEQFDSLNSFPDRAANGEIEGFSPNYNILSNSCIDLAGLALADANLADKGFDGTWYQTPENSIDDFERQILNHTNNEVIVDHNGEINVHNSIDAGYLNWNDTDSFAFISVYTDSNGTQMIDASDLERLIAHADDNEDWWELATVLEKLDLGEYQMSGELSDEANQELEEITNSASKRASYSIPDDFFESRSAAYANPNEYYQSKYGINAPYAHDTSSIY